MREIAALAKKSGRYLKSAQILLKDGDFESAVSRTYYAMFYSAQAMLLTQNLFASSHKGVISTFGIHFVKTGIFPREMGRELNRAFEKRQIGDYTFNFVITRAEAEQVLASGKSFCANIADYLREQKII